MAPAQSRPSVNNTGNAFTTLSNGAKAAASASKASITTREKKKATATASRSTIDPITKMVAAVGANGFHRIKACILTALSGCLCVIGLARPRP